MWYLKAVQLESNNLCQVLCGREYILLLNLRRMMMKQAFKHSACLLARDSVFNPSALSPTLIFDLT